MIETAPHAAELPTVEAESSFADARLRHQSLVFGFVARRIRPIEDAEDVVAAVFVDAYRHWNRRRGEPRLWLLGIARRKVADALRKKRNWWQVREDDLRADAMDDFMTRAQASAAAEIAAALPEDERDALLMQALEDLKIEEIAAVLGRSPKATNSLLQRARQRITRLVETRNRQGVSL